MLAGARTGGDLDGADHGEDGNESLEGHGEVLEMLLEEALRLRGVVLFNDDASCPLYLLCIVGGLAYMRACCP